MENSKSITIDIKHFEGALQINLQLLNLLETYMKKAGPWNAEMTFKITTARAALEEQKELCEIYKQAHILTDNLPK